MIFVSLARVFVAQTSLARLGPNDLGFDQNVIGAADHDQMFDIVAADDDELALAIKIEGVDNAKTQLTAAPARHPQPTPERQTEHQQNQERRNNKGYGRCAVGQSLVSTEPCHGLHMLI